MVGVGVVLLVVLGGTFLVAWAASAMAQTSVVMDGTLVAKGSPHSIVKTARAQQEIPAVFAPLLTNSQLGRVKLITLSNFKLMSTGLPCATCAQMVVLRVESILKYNRTTATVIAYGSPLVRIVLDRGLIRATGVPDGVPGQVYSACGTARCSSVKVDGINVAALQQAATTFNYYQHHSQTCT